MTPPSRRGFLGAAAAVATLGASDAAASDDEEIDYSPQNPEVRPDMSKVDETVADGRFSRFELYEDVSRESELEVLSHPADPNCSLTMRVRNPFAMMGVSLTYEEVEELHETLGEVID